MAPRGPSRQAPPILVPLNGPFPPLPSHREVTRKRKPQCLQPQGGPERDAMRGLDVRSVAQRLPRVRTPSPVLPSAISAPVTTTTAIARGLYPAQLPGAQSTSSRGGKKKKQTFSFLNDCGSTVSRGERREALCILHRLPPKVAPRASSAPPRTRASGRRLGPHGSRLLYQRRRRDSDRDRDTGPFLPWRPGDPRGHILSGATHLVSPARCSPSRTCRMRRTQSGTSWSGFVCFFSLGITFWRPNASFLLPARTSMSPTLIQTKHPSSLSLPGHGGN